MSTITGSSSRAAAAPSPCHNPADFADIFPRLHRGRQAVGVDAPPAPSSRESFGNHRTHQAHTSFCLRARGRSSRRSAKGARVGHKLLVVAVDADGTLASGARVDTGLFTKADTSVFQQVPFWYGFEVSSAATSNATARVGPAGFGAASATPSRAEPFAAAQQAEPAR